jgi:hypothetical protein
MGIHLAPRAIHVSKTTSRSRKAASGLPWQWVGFQSDEMNRLLRPPVLGWDENWEADLRARLLKQYNPGPHVEDIVGKVKEVRTWAEEVIAYSEPGHDQRLKEYIKKQEKKVRFDLALSGFQSTEVDRLFQPPVLSGWDVTWAHVLRERLAIKYNTGPYSEEIVRKVTEVREWLKENVWTDATLSLVPMMEPVNLGGSTNETQPTHNMAPLIQNSKRPAPDSGMDHMDLFSGEKSAPRPFSTPHDLPQQPFQPATPSNRRNQEEAPAKPATARVLRTNPDLTNMPPPSRPLSLPEGWTAHVDPKSG